MAGNVRFKSSRPEMPNCSASEKWASESAVVSQTLLGTRLCQPARPPTGVSLRPFLAGEAAVPRTEDEWVAFELFGNTYVVAGDYKAMRMRPGMWGDGKWHLYDIKQDPGETRPLEAEQPERLQKMIAIFERYPFRAGGSGVTLPPQPPG